MGRLREDFPVCEGDIVAAEHWAQSGFAGTDLDQLLRQHGADHVIVLGMMANTCAESTARYAMNWATTSRW
jgi:nicotinamidase-related amidase